MIYSTFILYIYLQDLYRKHILLQRKVVLLDTSNGGSMESSWAMILPHTTKSNINRQSVVTLWQHKQQADPIINLHSHILLWTTTDHKTSEPVRTTRTTVRIEQHHVAEHNKALPLPILQQREVIQCPHCGYGSASSALWVSSGGLPLRLLPLHPLLSTTPPVRHRATPVEGHDSISLRGSADDIRWWWWW